MSIQRVAGVTELSPHIAGVSRSRLPLTLHTEPPCSVAFSPPRHIIATHTCPPTNSLNCPSSHHRLKASQRRPIRGLTSWNPSPGTLSTHHSPTQLDKAHHRKRRGKLSPSRRKSPKSAIHHSAGRISRSRNSAGFLDHAVMSSSKGFLAEERMAWSSRLGSRGRRSPLP